MLEFEINNELHTQIQYRLIDKLSESERRYRELVESLREIVFKLRSPRTADLSEPSLDDYIGLFGF